MRASLCSCPSPPPSSSSRPTPPRRPLVLFLTGSYSFACVGWRAEHNCSLVKCDDKGTGGVVVACTDVHVWHERIIVEADVAICATPPSVTLNITDRTHPNFHFEKTLSASGIIGVPGLSFDIDHVEAGLFIDYQIAVESDELILELGAQLCGKIGPLHKCFPKHPVYFVKLKESVKNLCDGASVPRRTALLH
jgi:hypothetical protein